MPEEFQPEVAPVEDGQGAAEAVEGGGDQPSPSYFDPSEYADHLTRVTVDGQEIEVPVQELVQGYSRQADYTRKTQELAQQRQQLQFADAIATALQVNPAQAIALLQERYGVGQPQGQQEEEEFLDPVEREVRDLRSWQQSQLQREADARLQQDIAEASAVWDDVDPRAAVAYAYERGWEGPTAIADAFAALAGQKVLAERAAQRTMNESRAAEEQRVLEAKRQAQFIEGGAGAASRVAGAGPQQASTVAEAVAMAKQQLGISDITTLR